MITIIAFYKTDNQNIIDKQLTFAYDCNKHEK